MKIINNLYFILCTIFFISYNAYSMQGFSLQQGVQKTFSNQKKIDMFKWDVIFDTTLKFTLMGLQYWCNSSQDSLYKNRFLLGASLAALPYYYSNQIIQNSFSDYSKAPYLLRVFLDSSFFATEALLSGIHVGIDIKNNTFSKRTLLETIITGIGIFGISWEIYRKYKNKRNQNSNIIRAQLNQQIVYSRP